MNKHKSKKIIQSKGFTLIEILVAMVMLSMTLLLLFSSLFTANKYWTIGENKIEKNEEIRLASTFIRKQITQTIPLLWIDATKRKLLFQGQHDELSFVSTLPSHRGGGGIHSLRLEVIQIDDGSQLGMSYSLLSPDIFPFADDTDKEEEFVAIADNINSINLSYYGKENNNEEPRWFDVWDNNKYLPQLVRIKIISLDRNINWPVIEITVKASYVSGSPEFTIRATSS